MTRISVIIPSFNRADRLHACLQSLAGQSIDPDTFEVIVVLDGCTDDSAERLRALDTPYRLTVLEQENAGPGKARNHGAREARSPVCLFLDDDVRAVPELLRSHLQLHDLLQCTVGIGAVEIRLDADADWFARHFATGWQAHQKRLTTGSRQPTWEDCLSGNLSVPKNLFFAAGGFADDLRRSEDVELGYRLSRAGLTFAYISNAVAIQQDGKSIREYAPDFEKSGAAWVDVGDRHPELVPTLLAPVIDVGAREGLVRQILSALRVSPRLLAGIAPVFGHSSADGRWYRFTFRYAYWRGVRRRLAERNEWQAVRRSAAILTYHAFGDGDRSASRHIVPIRQFERQVEGLRRLGFSILSLDQYLELRSSRVPPPRRAVVITIDDGYAELATLVAPILERHHVPATLFVVTSLVGKRNVWDAEGPLAGRRLLSWDEIRRLSDAGVHFGGHTHTHPSLSRLEPAKARFELESSKHELEAVLGRPVTALAYPYGDFDDATAQMAQEAGYVGACSVEPGLNSAYTPMYALRRITVDGRWSLLRFMVAAWLGVTRMPFRPRKRGAVPIEGTEKIAMKPVPG